VAAVLPDLVGLGMFTYGSHYCQAVYNITQRATARMACGYYFNLVSACSKSAIRATQKGDRLLPPAGRRRTVLRVSNPLIGNNLSPGGSRLVGGARRGSHLHVPVATGLRPCGHLPDNGLPDA